MKGMVKPFHHIHPTFFPTIDSVEIPFDLGGKAKVDDFIEMVGEEIRHYLSHIVGFETFVFNLFDLATVLYRGNGGSKSRRSSDSLGFKFFY